MSHSKISSPSIIKGVFVVSLFLLMVIAFIFLVSNSSSHFLPNFRILSRSSFINAVLFSLSPVGIFDCVVMSSAYVINHCVFRFSIVSHNCFDKWFIVGHVV